MTAVSAYINVAGCHTNTVAAPANSSLCAIEPHFYQRTFAAFGVDGSYDGIQNAFAEKTLAELETVAAQADIPLNRVNGAVGPRDRAGHRERVSHRFEKDKLEVLSNTHENLTGGTTFVYRSDSRGNLFHRKLRTDDGIQDP